MLGRWRRRAARARKVLLFALGILASLPEHLAEWAGATEPDPDRVAIVPVEVFLVVDEGEAVVPRAWLDAQIAHANELFAPAGVGFDVEKVWKISDRAQHIETRRDRDSLAAYPRALGRIHVFVVRHLDDVDIEGERLFGVHWRYRRDRRETWVILSARDETSTVLAHELGHLFELGHSRFRESIMNKRPREEPPWRERVFAEPELERIRRQARRFFDSGRLAPLSRPDESANRSSSR